MAIFMIIIAICRLHKTLRYSALAGLMLWLVSCDRWELVLFLAGMLIADIDSASSATERDELYGTVSASACRAASLFWILIVLLGAFLVSIPGPGNPDWAGGATEAFGYKTLTSLVQNVYTGGGWNITPLLGPYRVWESVGAVLLLCAAMHDKTARWFLETPVLQYLGDISYALYIVHGPMVTSVGFALVGHAQNLIGVKDRAYILGGQDRFDYMAGVWLAYLPFLPLVITLADLFWRAFDAPSVRFSKWLEDKCFMKQTCIDGGR